MSTTHTTLWRGLTAAVVLSLLLAACGTGAATTTAPTSPPATQAPQPTATTAEVATAAPTEAPTAAPTEAPTEAPTAAAFVSKPSGKTTSTGFACPEPQPRMDLQSKAVNLFVWTEYIPQDILDCFQLVYGITVNRDEYSANEDMGAKLLAGGTNYDIVQPTDYFVTYLLRQKLLQKLDKSKLSILGNFAPQYLGLAFDPNNDYTVPYEAGTDSIVVNTAKVTDVPKSWADLWKPEYAGKMVFLDDSRATIGMVLLTLGYDVNTKDPKQLDEAKAKLAQLVPNIKLFDSDSPKTALIAGDVDLGMTWTFEALAAQRENPAIQFIYPTEGSIVWQDNYAIPVGAPHLDTAYAWLNYTMQPDLFWLMLRDFAYINPDQAALDFAKTSQIEVTDASGTGTTTPAKLYEEYINSSITNPPLEAIKNGHRIDDVGDALPLYDKIWTEVKGGK
jgi:spermidine/putrescine transport system substrate-binding protein